MVAKRVRIKSVTLKRLINMARHAATNGRDPVMYLRHRLSSMGYDVARLEKLIDTAVDNLIVCE